MNKDEKLRRVYVPMTETGKLLYDRNRSVFPAGGTPWLSCNSICEKKLQITKSL